ncbi:hypothetical protein BLNAU_7578 [Blattamonas nauphoetae]|uniref:Glutaredoxin n=1 Tax=Blattamonas nauphoetae TaxID=2049346 RepID=A0ABQ9Y111_9EUKA|nr:hypothetical protein BLNAU_7578 [Blattamonas nauphoetae]
MIISAILSIVLCEEMTLTGTRGLDVLFELSPVNVIYNSNNNETREMKELLKEHKVEFQDQHRGVLGMYEIEMRKKLCDHFGWVNTYGIYPVILTRQRVIGGLAELKQYIASGDLAAILKGEKEVGVMVYRPESEANKHHHEL